jgi:hypothetical protein
MCYGTELRSMAILDTIETGAALADGRTAQQIVDDFASDQGATTVFDFGSGDVLRVVGAQSADLMDDIIVV